MTKWRGAVRGLLRPWWICLRGFGGISKIYLFFFYNIVCGVFSKCISFLTAPRIHTKLSTLRFEYITAPAGSFYEEYLRITEMSLTQKMNPKNYLSSKSSLLMPACFKISINVPFKKIFFVNRNYNPLSGLLFGF